MTTYRIGEVHVDLGSSDGQEALLRAYEAKARPTCLCVSPPPEMYIAKVDGRYLVKRMPDTGSRHSPGCDSYQAPPELSGYGAVAGKAITENADSGETVLRLDFSLSKLTGRAAPPATSSTSDTVRTDGAKLTLRGLLHYLWEEAELNRWVPAMSGRRTWYVVRKCLCHAAEQKVAKGGALATSLYVPEAFQAERKAEINGRRAARFAPIAAKQAWGTRKLMLIIAEVKEIAPSRFGDKVWFKHMPDLGFHVEPDLGRRLQKRFGGLMELWRADASTHLISIATFGIGPTGVCGLEEASLMLVNEHWLPVESQFDAELLAALAASGRRFTKSLRYNLADSAPLATAVLTDTTPCATALYVVNPVNGEEAVPQVIDLMRDSELTAWAWLAGSTPLPPLPSRGPYLVSVEDAIDDLISHQEAVRDLI